MLEFVVNHQELKRVDNNTPATDSVDYLKAQFNFVTDDWKPYSERYAVFTAGDITKRAYIVNNVCTVPHEVLEKSTERSALVSGNKFTITVIGINNDSRVTTNALKCSLNESGYIECEESEQPTPDLYEQYISAVSAEADRAEAATAKAEESAAEIKAYDEAVKNNYANAFKGEASGEVIRVDDVSPVEHTVKAKVSGKNILPYPYPQTTYTGNGGTFTVQADGGIVAEGTPTDYVSLNLYSDSPLAKSGNLVFSASGDYENVSISMVLYDSANNVLFNAEAWKGRNPISVNLDEYPTVSKWLVFIKRSSPNVEMTGTIYPQLEIGDTATEYTPYIDPATVTLTRCGKNLLQPTDRSVAGYTAKVNEDGSVTVTGAANKTNGIYLTLASPSENNPLVLTKGQKYYIQSWSNNDRNVLLKCIKLDGTEFWTSPTDFNKTGGVEYKSIVQVYVESTKHAEGDTSLCGIYKFMLEVGDTATDFEAYNSETYTPETDGTVNIKSVSPTMTLLTDTEGVTIDCEYNRDINTVIADIYSKISG